MADRAVDELQIRLYRLFADVFYLFRIGNSLHLGIRAVREVYFIGIFDERLRLILPDEFGQFPAYVRGKGKLAVRKRTRPRKPRGDVAVSAMHADARFRLGTRPFFNGGALFHYGYFAFISFVEQFERGKYACRPRAYDQCIRSFHIVLSRLVRLSYPLLSSAA